MKLKSFKNWRSFFKFNTKASEHKENVKFNNILTNKYNFGNFVLANFNKNIIKAYENIIEAETIIYSPLFLYGSSGIGKTHFTCNWKWVYQKEEDSLLHSFKRFYNINY